MKRSLLIFSVLLSVWVWCGCKSKVPDCPDVPIVIIYENDVHCAVDGYAKLVGLREQYRHQTPYVSTVSCGDFVQGDIIGALSKGERIVDIMNKVGYDVVTLGNHEFDFGMQQLMKLTDSLGVSVVSTNFCDFNTGKLVFPPYRILHYGDVDIAFLGFTTTTTATMVAPLTFLDEDGKIMYGFSRPFFYENAQTYIDEVRARGADYVVILSHMGDMDRGEHPSSISLITRTTGVDVVLDGHDHRVIADTIIHNKNGLPVLLTSTGSKMENIGVLTLSTEGKFAARLVPSADIEVNEEIQAFVEIVKENTLLDGEKVVGINEVFLSPDDESGKRLVRSEETNIGNFCTDAFRKVLNTDIAMINGGGIRSDIPEGDVTYNHLLSVFPFNNMACIAVMTGKQLVDALEFSVRSLPREDGNFMQVSGIRFDVDTSVPSPVLMDEYQLFTGVGEGPRRVSHVCIWNESVGDYVPVDLKCQYTLASFDYQIKKMGCAGIFRYATLKDDCLSLDVEVLASYLTNVLNGKVGKEYKGTEGRIRIR